MGQLREEWQEDGAAVGLIGLGGAGEDSGLELRPLLEHGATEVVAADPGAVPLRSREDEVRLTFAARQRRQRLQRRGLTDPSAHAS